MVTISSCPSDSGINSVGLLVTRPLSGTAQGIKRLLEQNGISCVVGLVEHEGSDDRPSFVAREMMRMDRIFSKFLYGSQAHVNDPKEPLRTIELAELIEARLQGIIFLGTSPKLTEASNVADAPPIYELRIGAPCAYPGMAEVLNREPVVQIRLSQAKADTPAKVIGKMAVQTHDASISLTSASITATLPEFLLAILPKLKTAAAEPSSKDHRPHASSQNQGPRLRDAIRHACTLTKAVFERIAYKPQWILGVLPAKGLIADWDWQAIQPVVPPNDRFWADPCVVRKDKQTWLFFEEAFYRSDKGSAIGHIVAAPVDQNGLIGPVVRVLERPYHLSYPNVFEHEGAWFMIPESGSEGRVDLYECTDWPRGWRYHSTLIENLEGYDATLLRQDGAYWLFVARRARGLSTTDFLDIFHATSPFGPWTPHRANPVVKDVRSSRPAGPLLYSGHRLLRPAQDSSGGRYGRALRFQEIVRMDDEQYIERPLLLIEPNESAGVNGIHSYATDGHVAVVDLCRKIPRLAGIPFLSARRLSRNLVQAKVFESPSAQP